MNQFERSIPGRILGFALSATFVAGGAAALFGEPYATWIVAGSFPVMIALSTLALAMSIAEHWKVAILAVIALPWFLLLYSIGIGYVIQEIPNAGWALLILGAGGVARALMYGRNTTENTARPGARQERAFSS